MTPVIRSTLLKRSYAMTDDPWRAHVEERFAKPVVREHVPIPDQPSSPRLGVDNDNEERTEEEAGA